MASCSRCGDSIEFRYINGRCTPIHRNGGCAGGGGAVNSYAGYRYSEDSCCFLTACPKCGEQVFFIRHNGGCVWIDPPLGSPWFKHQCFDEPPAASGARPCLGDISADAGSSYLILGVVRSTDVAWSGAYTVLRLEAGERASHKLLVKNSAGFLAGRMCVYDPSEKVIYPVGEQHLRFGVLTEVLNKGDPRAQDVRLDCPECGVKLYLRNLRRHFTKQHLMEL